MGPFIDQSSILHATGDFWILWAFAAPATVLVLLLWFTWQNRTEIALWWSGFRQRHGATTQTRNDDLSSRVYGRATVPAQYDDGFEDPVDGLAAADHGLVLSPRPPMASVAPGMIRPTRMPSWAYHATADASAPKRSSIQSGIREVTPPARTPGPYSAAQNNPATRISKRSGMHTGDSRTSSVQSEKGFTVLPARPSSALSTAQDRIATPRSGRSGLHTTNSRTPSVQSVGGVTAPPGTPFSPPVTAQDISTAPRSVGSHADMAAATISDTGANITTASSQGEPRVSQ